MASNILGLVAAAVSLLTTELNSLANGSFATAGSAYDNGTNLYLWGDFELVVGTGSAMTANNTFDLYLLPSVDGTNYIDTTGPPPNAYVGSFVCQAATSGRYILRDVPLPLSKFKAYIKNGSGQALSSSGSTLKLLPCANQST